MARIALLINEEPVFEDGNNLRFARELNNLGYQVDILLIDTLRLLGGSVCADGFAWQNALDIGARFPPATTIAVDHALVWLLGLGDRRSFLDKYQLLYALPAHCRLINSLEAVMHLKSKYFLASHTNIFPNPETHASADADELIRIAREKGGEWIVKPPAGSLGVDVYRVSHDDVALEPTISQLCGTDNNRYTLLQRYVPEIERGEKRVLLAGGQIMGQYRRNAIPGNTTNINRGASASACGLDPAERDYCERLARHILDMGAYFAGVDLAWPWLIEINVINPGGITTIDGLTGQDLAPGTVNAVLSTAGGLS